MLDQTLFTYLMKNTSPTMACNFYNKLMSPNLSNIVRYKIDGSDLIYALDMFPFFIA
jgi:hypothetical protein